MKKLFLAVLILYTGSSLLAQPRTDGPNPRKAPPAATVIQDGATCAALQKLAALAAGDDLYNLVGDSFPSMYMKPYFGAELFKSSANLPEVLESFVTLDRSEGARYNAYIKDYGSNATAAKADLKKLVAAYSACLPAAVVTNKDDETSILKLPKCKIELHAYQCSFTNTWTINVTLSHRN